jgi:hypothetical protein
VVPAILFFSFPPFIAVPVLVLPYFGNTSIAVANLGGACWWVAVSYLDFALSYVPIGRTGVSALPSVCKYFLQKNLASLI